MMEETRGRPQKDPEETFSKQVAIPVAPSQKEIAKLEADRCEVSVSELVRGVFFNGSLAYARRFGRSDISDTLVNRLDGPEIREYYSEPMPRDFQKLQAIVAEMRAKDLRDGQSLEEVKQFVQDLEGRILKILYVEYNIRGRNRKEVREEKENKRKTSRIQVRVRKKDWDWIDQVNRSCEVMEGNSSFVRRVVFFWIRMNEIFTRTKSPVDDVFTEVFEPKQTIEERISDALPPIEEKAEVIEEVEEELETIADLIEEVQRQRGFRSLRR